jgi:hypothetical protein
VTALDLPTVTLCAATSTNIAATVAAIAASSEQIHFGDVLLLTDSAAVESLPGGRIERIAPLRSASDYSRFVLGQLADHVQTEHCLVIQWDGFVIDPGQWDERFVECDYVGAPWPQFGDGHDVGNGGFSLRSRKLIEACRSPGFTQSHPEDVAIGRTNRAFLEREHGIVFADSDTAGRFAFERSAPARPTFGFHGAFNMIPLLGADRFWRLYEGLDDPRTVFHDYGLVMRQLGSGRGAARRRLELSLDLVRSRAAKARAISRRP